MAPAAMFGLLACFLISFVLVGAAFFAWWTNFTQIKALPDVEGKLAPLAVRLEALEVRITQLSEAPASLRKRVDEAEEASKWASKKIETFTGQVGVLQKMVKQLKEEEDEEGDKKTAAPQLSLAEMGGMPLFEQPQQKAAQEPGMVPGFGKKFRKVG